MKNALLLVNSCFGRIFRLGAATSLFSVAILIACCRPWRWWLMKSWRWDGTVSCTRTPPRQNMLAPQPVKTPSVGASVATLPAHSNSTIWLKGVSHEIFRVLFCYVGIDLGLYKNLWLFNFFLLSLWFYIYV